MSRWRDSDAWSSWTCATCDVEQTDPDTISVTSCANGHTNYLEPANPRSNHRRAHATAKARRETLSFEKQTRELLHSAFKAAQKKRPNMPSKVITNPSISICRDSKVFAMFDGPTSLTEFAPYKSEEDAIKAGKEFFDGCGVEPHIIYPRITKMTMTYAKAKKRSTKA